MKKITAVILGAFIICISGGLLASAQGTVEDPSSAASAPTGVIVSEASDRGYSIDELNEVAAEIKKLMVTEKWITGLRVDEEKKMIYVGCDENADPIRIKEAAKALSDKFGNGISGVIAFTGADLSDDTADRAAGFDKGASDMSGMWLYILPCCVAFAALFTAMLMYRRKRQLAYQAADGSVVSSDEHLSGRNIKSRIQENAYVPQDDDFSGICDKIESRKK